MSNAQEDSEKQQLPPDLLKYTGIACISFGFISI